MANKKALKIAMKAVNFMCRCNAAQGYTWSSSTDEWSRGVRRRGKKYKKEIKQALDKQ